MSCENVRECLINLGAAEKRREIQDALKHLEGCAECQAAMREFDRLADMLDTSQDNAEPERGWGAFEEKLQSTVNRFARSMGVSPMFYAKSMGETPMLRPKISQRTITQNALSLWWPMAMAACVLFAAGGYEIGRRAMSGPTPIVAQADHFVPANLNTDVKAFQQVSQVFDGKASWLLVSHQASDVGIAASPVPPVGRVLLLHLSVSHGGAAVSEADLLIVPGQTADLHVPLEGDQSLHYRISASAGLPTHLAVWLEAVGSHSQQTLGALATTLQAEPGEKMNAGELTTSAGNYQLHIGFAQADTAGDTEGGHS